MIYIVFSQEPAGVPNMDRLGAQAARFFASTLQTLQLGDSSVDLRLATSRPVIEATFRIVVRATTREDLAEAHRAEIRGRAAGMGALAEKCAYVWELGAVSAEPPSDVAYLTLAAICASVALGPVMPPDRSTLFGVRGAIERRDRLLQGST